jgi:hypothetical protein
MFIITTLQYMQNAEQVILVLSCKSCFRLSPYQYRHVFNESARADNDKLGTPWSETQWLPTNTSPALSSYLNMHNTNAVDDSRRTHGNCFDPHRTSHQTWTYTEKSRRAVQRKSLNTPIFASGSEWNDKRIDKK